MERGRHRSGEARTWPDEAPHPDSVPAVVSMPAAALSPARSHLVVVGFMGAGKSTVGRLIAERTGRPFVDLDDAIAEEAGQCIADFIRKSGAVALKAKERAVLRRLLASSQPLVIATGGETFLDTTVRDWLRVRAHTVFLEAEPETLVRRLSAGNPLQQRPVKPGPNLVETVRRQLVGVTPIYREASLTVHNDGERIEEVVGEIARQLRLDRTEHGRTPRRAAG
ncbi:MAG: AAA family ATPase [Deltaproteobacteria bacterium]|nr:AAA family ATPase [Deltaproteobacteria bacterium]